MLSPEEQQMVLDQVRQYDNALLREEGSQDFMKFVTTMWPGFIHGRHHALMAKKFEQIANGEVKRLIINMPPRHTRKSKTSSRDNRKRYR